MNDDELQQRLQALDPASDLTPADPARVARLLEDTMDTDLAPHETPIEQRRRTPLTWLVAAAAVLVAGVGVVALLGNDPESGKVPSAAPSTPESSLASFIELTAPQPSTAKCLVPNAQTLSQAEVAFSGTVASVEDDLVEITPDRFYHGGAVDLVEVRAPAELMTALVGAVDFQEGQRYLVSANDGQVTVCGFSGPYSPTLEALYVEAFPG